MVPDYKSMVREIVAGLEKQVADGHAVTAEQCVASLLPGDPENRVVRDWA
jgi:hypothetical protein